MSSYLAVQHPIDPSTAEFDFWAWRVYRRLIIDRFKALAQIESPEKARRLANWALRMEIEEFGERDLQAVRDYLSSYTPREIRTQNDLFECLVAITTARDTVVENHWYLPTIRPDWDSIPVMRPLFAGHVSGLPLRARLGLSKKTVPAYSIIWLNRDGSEEPPIDIHGAVIGANLPYIEAVWDWLFTRRLTLLCHAGMNSWPDPDAPPIVLPDLDKLHPMEF